MKDSYDLIVIGSGPGGMEAAKQAKKEGLSVVLAEENLMGGTCLNKGCIPTKALLYASKLYKSCLQKPDSGNNNDSPNQCYITAHRHKDECIKKLREDALRGLKKAGIDCIAAHASLQEAGVKLSDGSVIKAENIILATGSVPVKLPVKGGDLPRVITSDDFLNLEKLPKSIVIIGGGVIGCECACLLNNFGVKVTIIEALERLLSGFDREISQSIRMLFIKRGIEVYNKACVEEIKEIVHPDGGENNTVLSCVFNSENNSYHAEGEYVYCAAGRRPNTQGLGIKTDSKGNAVVDDNFLTNMNHVYAIGDMTGTSCLAHSASFQARYVINHILKKDDSLILSLVPGCVYTDPEIATVGMTENEINNTGIETVSAKAVMGANARSVIEKEDRGFIKLTAVKETGRLVSGTLMCARATDMIGEIELAIANELTVRDFLKIMRAHPTYEESFTEAAFMLLQKI